MTMNILYELGAYGPLLLMFLSWYLLWNNKHLFFYYTIGIFISSVINIILKGIIQQPRPMFDEKKIKLLKTHGKQYFYQSGIPFDIFGMPSGHAQAAFFSTAYIYLGLKQFNWLFFYFILSLLTCYQRVKFYFHSVSQVLVGAIVGSLFAYFVFHFAKENIKGPIREKPDENGPV